jgi:hypothetical protein
MSHFESALSTLLLTYESAKLTRTSIMKALDYILRERGGEV